MRCGAAVGLLSLWLATAVMAADWPDELDWLALMPVEDQQALESMPELDHGSPEAAGFSGGGQWQGAELPQVMHSTRTVETLAGQSVRLGGYAVPLQQDARGAMTEFLLVPYPGACIHVPPPPPNQIVSVSWPEGLLLEDLYSPVWVVGELAIDVRDTGLARVAYVMQAEQVRPVQLDDL